MKTIMLAGIAIACLSGAALARTYSDEDVEKLVKQVKQLQADLLEQGRKATQLEIRAADLQSKITVLQEDAKARDAQIKSLEQAVAGYERRNLHVRWSPGDWQPIGKLIATASCEADESFVGLIYELSGTPQNPPFVVTKLAPDGPAGGKMTWETEQQKGLVRVLAACARLY